MRIGTDPAPFSPGQHPVDPTNGGLSLTLAVPGGDTMRMIAMQIAGADVKAKGGGKRFKAKATTEQGKVNVSLKRTKSGDYKVVAKIKKADLSVLRNGSRDVTVAVVAGGTQFVKNRLLTEKKKGRVLAIRKKG